MSDFRDRLGAELGAAATRLSAAEVDFRDRLSFQLAAAAAELLPGHAPTIAPADRRGGELAADFRDRFGGQLAAAAGTLAAADRAGAGAPARARIIPWPVPAGRGDFRARLGLQLAACAGALAEERERERATNRRRPRLAGARASALLPRLARPLAVTIALTGLAGAATASSLWLAPVGKHDGGVNPGLSATPPPAAQLDALAVLRAPQSASDRGPGVLTELEDVNNFTTGVRSNYVRVLEKTANGPVVLVPVAERRAVAAGVAGAGGRDAIADALCVYYPVSGAGALGSSPDCWSTAALLAGHAISSADGHLFGLAPDGVESVAIALGGASAPVSATVADNFFDAQLPPSGATASAGGRARVGGAPPPPVARPVVTFRTRAVGRAGAVGGHSPSPAHARRGP
jgi:hypothetical protein